MVLLSIFRTMRYWGAGVPVIPAVSISKVRLVGVELTNVGEVGASEGDVPVVMSVVIGEPIGLRRVPYALDASAQK